MENINKNIIVCPHCGWEYTPAEIFYPEDIFGTQDHEIRDVLGHILYVDYKEGKEPALSERYNCDHCNKDFIATINLSFKTSEEAPELDFSSQEESLL